MLVELRCPIEIKLCEEISAGVMITVELLYGPNKLNRILYKN